jgi:carbon monoxide dehydrogenase subunit G
MEFDNSFDVPLAPADAWAVLMDIRRIAPCMPGAALTEIIDPQNFRGKIAVRLGPVALAFAGTLQLENIDEVNRSAQVKAQGADDKGRGSANAMATFRIEPSGTGSRVLIHTDLMLSGAVAQYGRGVGMIQATASQIIGQFAANLRKQLEVSRSAAGAPTPAPAPSAAAPAPTPVSVPAAAAPARASIPVPTPQRNAALPPRPEPPLPPPAKPISGLSLIAAVLWRRLVTLFGGGKD